MKKTNRKGFTIVELVIVIAVIAILAAVLIPTFGGMIEKANNSKALQEAKNTYQEDLALLDGQASNYTNDQYYEYALTGDTTFADGTDYYTKSGAKYVKATVTAGAAVTENTYYEKEESICSGSFADDGTYTYTTKDTKYICKYSNGTWDIDKNN